jgi:hypothetical protein
MTPFNFIHIHLLFTYMYKRKSKVIIICSQDMQNQKQTKMALYKDIL